MSIDPKIMKDVVDHLLTLDGATMSSDNNEVLMRCPFCLDSDTQKNAKSFSVRIVPRDDDEFLPYHCFRARCLASGIVNQEFLEKLGYNNHRAFAEFSRYNYKASMKINPNYKLGQTNYFRKELEPVVDTDDELNVLKLSYINKRLGTDMTFKDAMSFKIIFDPSYMMKFNDVEITDPKKLYKLKLFTDYGIGFLSSYNDFFIVREIVKGKFTSKYLNENIFDNSKSNEITKMYMIPTSLDILSPKKTIIHIAEGIITVLGVYHHLNWDRDYDGNQLFMAPCGTGLYGAVMHIVKSYAIIDAEIHIYADRDVKKSFFNNFNKLKPYMDRLSVYVHYNNYEHKDGTFENDFGTKKKYIKDVVSVII